MNTSMIVRLLGATLLSSLALTAAYASEGGGGATGVGGGGDECEARIQEIRDDILSWIEKGGPEGFQNISVSVQEYSDRMRKALAVSREANGAFKPATQIECIHHSNNVQGVEKVCRFDLLVSGAKITCDAEAFLNKSTMSADEQYRLIHHEYAGIAGLEVPSGSQSNYAYSNQLSSFLENQVVRKLAVKAPVFNTSSSVLDEILQAKQVGPSHRSVLYVEVANYDPYTGDAGFFSSARDIYDAGGNTYGWTHYATLKEALTGLVAKLKIVALFDLSPRPDEETCKRLELQEFESFLYQPELALGLSDDAINDLDVMFSGMSKTFLQIGAAADGTVIVRAPEGKIIAAEKTFAQALQAGLEASR